MADNKSSPGGGVFGFLKKQFSGSAQDDTVPSTPVVEGSVESVEAIAPLLVAVLQEKLPVRVFLGNSSFPYYSFFEWELLEDQDGKVLDSKTHLEQGEYLLMAALDPPIGNIKIRSATEINLEFFTRFHLLHCLVTLRRITGSRKLCFDFPTLLQQKPQRRSSFRAPINRDMEISVSVTRPSGIAINAKLADISVGGTAFYPTGATPRIADHSKVEMDIVYPEGKFSVDAVVLGSFPRDGEQYFRVQFLVASHKSAGEVGAFVSYVQRENTHKRTQTFQ